MKKLLATLLIAVFLLSPRPTLGASSPSISIKPVPTKFYYVEDEDIVLEVRSSGDVSRGLLVVLDCTAYYSDSVIVVEKDESFRQQFRFRTMPEGVCIGYVRTIWRDPETGKEKSKLVKTQEMIVVGKHF